MAATTNAELGTVYGGTRPVDVDGVRLELTHASRILSATGVLDAFGHVSCRHPQKPDHFFMSRRMAPGLVTPADIYEHDAEANGVTEPNKSLFLERFIHSEIYRSRPDVISVVHSHSPAVLPFTVVSDVRLRPLAHVCGFVEGTGPAFDIAEHDGHGTDLLIRTPELGRAFAGHMGETSVGLMRSHGFTTVGVSVRQSVYRAIYTGVNSSLQMDALRLGEPRYMTAAEAKACEDTTNGQIDRVWALWEERHGYVPGN